MDHPHRARAIAAVERNAVCAKASSDWQGALEDAQRIAIAWYRAQALAHVVQHAPASETDRLVELFDAAASAGKDDYQRATLPFWLALALLGRKDGERAEQVALGILENSVRIVPIGSRAETLKMVTLVFLVLRSPRL